MKTCLTRLWSLEKLSTNNFLRHNQKHKHLHIHGPAGIFYLHRTHTLAVVIAPFSETASLNKLLHTIESITSDLNEVNFVVCVTSRICFWQPKQRGRLTLLAANCAKSRKRAQINYFLPYPLGFPLALHAIRYLMFVVVWSKSPPGGKGLAWNNFTLKEKNNSSWLSTIVMAQVRVRVDLEWLTRILANHGSPGLHLLHHIR